MPSAEVAQDLLHQPWVINERDDAHRALTHGAAQRVNMPAAQNQFPGGRDRHAGRGGLPHEGDLCRGQAVGLVDEIAEGALQGQDSGGDGAGGGDGSGVFVAQGMEAGGGEGLLLVVIPTGVSSSRGASYSS